MQEGTGKLAAEEGRCTNQERGGGIGPPRVVRPEVLHCCTVDRQLVQTERSYIKDVIEVTGVTHA